MITKYVLIVWIGLGNSQTLSTQSLDTLAECRAIASVLESEINDSGWYRCRAYSYEETE